MAPGIARGCISREINHSRAPSTDENVTTAPKRVRGIARNLAAEKIFAATRTKIRVDFAHGRPSGFNRKAFVAEIGVVVRNYAPLQADNWSEITDDERDELVNRLLTKFDIDMSNQVVSRYVFNRMSSRYNDHRYRLKKHFKKFSLEEVRDHPHRKVSSKEDWEFLCTLWSSPKFMTRSRKCVESRKKVRFNHRGGSKSFVQHAYEEDDGQIKETPKGRIDLFHDTHYNSDRGWINTEAETAYNTMVELHHSNPEMTEAQVCEQVLGKRSGYVIGFGFGPRPDTFGSRYKENNNAENEALKSEVSRLNDIVESQGAMIQKFMAFQAWAEAHIGPMDGSS